jgi:flagellar basal-body rod modification protein FlgD
MPMSGISGVGATPTTTASQGQGLGAMDSEAFLKLLVAQLRYQNPMEPTDASAMMQQTAQFSQVETLQSVAKLQQQLLGLHEAATASSLLGQQITARGSTGADTQGVVESVSFTQQGPVLSVGGEQVPLAAVVEIGAPAAPLTEF